mgnify:CR=1 FL=1
MTPEWKWRNLVPSGLQGSQKAEIFIQFLFLFEEIPQLQELIWQRWDEVDRSLLPYLLQYFNLDPFVDWVDLGEDGIRNLLKEAIEWHRHRGTPYALHKYLELIGAEGELEEWWQTGSTPYTAKLNLWGDAPQNAQLDFSSQELIESIIQAIDFAKPAARDIAVRFGYRLKITPTIVKTDTPTPIAEIPGRKHFINPLGKAEVSGVKTPAGIAEIPQDSPYFRVSATMMGVVQNSPVPFLDI